jgi:hypothetical protein
VDGEIYDPTLIQFKHLRSYRPDNVQREVLERYSVHDFRRKLLMMSLDQFLFWQSRVQEFGGVMTL